MRPDELLESLKARFAKGKSGRISISADEIAEWPNGLFDSLFKANLLQPIAPASMLECRGCEELCFMPINVLPAESKRAARAFIVCDKRDDVGRVSVDFARLKQWAISYTAFGKMQSSFFLPAAARDDEKQTIKKSKAPLAFRLALKGLLEEVNVRAIKLGDSFDLHAMPGRKRDFQEVANGFDPELRHTRRTFDDYLKGICWFTRGARETDFYRNLFPECFK